MEEILHDFIYQNLGNHGSVLCLGSCRIYIINSRVAGPSELFKLCGIIDWWVVRVGSIISGMLQLCRGSVTDHDMTLQL